MKTLNKGLLPLPKDERDYQLGALIKWPKLSELPVKFSVEPISIKNQLEDGNEDFCGACAGTGMIEPKEGMELFYPYLFAAAKKISGGDPDNWGTDLRSIGKALQKYGVPETKDVPEIIKNLSLEDRRRLERYSGLQMHALDHRAKSYFFVKGPYDPYDDARAALWYFRANRQQILFGVNWGWSLDQYELTGTPDGFGHAMWLAGWDEGGVIAVNSAGKEAGRDGKHLISRETFNKYASDFGMLMVVDLSPDEAKYYVDNGVSLDDNWIVGFAKTFANILKNLWRK